MKQKKIEWKENETPEELAERMRSIWTALRKCDSCKYYTKEPITFLNFGADTSIIDFCKKTKEEVKCISKGSWCKKWRRKIILSY